MLRLRFRTLIVFFLVFLTNIGSSYAADKWLSVRSNNFLLVGNASESSIKRVGRELEEFRSALGSLFASANQQATIGTTVIVFKDDASFRPYKPLYEGKAGNVAGYFQAGEDVNFIALAADTPSPRVLYHEFVHSLTNDTALPLPPWVGEGLAEVYSMFENSGKEILLGRAIGDHVGILNQQKMLPLDVLFSVEHGSPNYNEKTKQGLFYAQSWASVHYLMFGNGGKRRPQLSKYLTLASNGKTAEENFKEAFQTDYKTLEEEIRNYIQQQVAWPALRIKLQEKLDFDREMKVSSLSEAQAQYYLGDLMLHTHRLDAAEAPLLKAVDLDPKFAASYASLGLLRFRQGKKEDALKFLSQAAERDSQNHLAHYYYASLLEQLKEAGSAAEDKTRLDLMRTHIKKTIELAPRFVHAYSLLGYIALVSHQETQEAEEALKKAIGYAPGRAELRITLAQLMMMNNEAMPARALLTSLRNSAVDDEIKYRAEQLLTDIKNRQQYEQDLRAYQERVAASQAVTPPPPITPTPTTTIVETDTPLPERPRLVRGDTSPAKPPEENVVETAKPQARVPQGTRVEGLLVAIDCSKGLTLRLRVGNGVVELHTDVPGQVEFMSYVKAVKDTFDCGPMKSEVPAAIIYKRTTDPRFLGEPLRVEFVDRR